MRRTAILPLSLAFAAAIALVWPTDAEAQRRGRATRVVVAGGFYGPYASPFYGPFYSPFYDPWFGGPWGWGSGYPYWRMAGPEASVRLDVRPRDAQVYVDGFFAGTVDQFDGVFQRLRLPPGQHEIAVYKDGYRTVRDRLYLAVNSSRKLTHDLDRLAPGEANEPLPAPVVSPEDAPGQRGEPADEGAPPPPSPRVRRGPGPGAPPRSVRGAGRSNTGAIAIRVQPGDATIFVDGEQWAGGGDDERLIVQVPEGTHRVEVEKAGFRRVTLEVQVRRGETSPVNVSLSHD